MSISSVMPPSSITSIVTNSSLLMVLTFVLQNFKQSGLNCDLFFVFLSLLVFFIFLRATLILRATLGTILRAKFYYPFSSLLTENSKHKNRDHTKQNTQAYKHAKPKSNSLF
jgi:hypothetical protein